MSLVRFRPEAPIFTKDHGIDSIWFRRSASRLPTGGQDAGVAHLVERHLAKVEVAGSSPVTRSKQIRNAQGVPYFIRYRGQVVRQESAKLSFASSNLAGTSMFTQHFRCNSEKVASKVLFAGIY